MLFCFVGGGNARHPGFTEGFTEGSRKLGRRKDSLLPASVFGEVGYPTSRYTGSVLGSLRGTVSLLSRSSAKNLTSPTEGKSLLPSCQLGKHQTLSWLWWRPCVLPRGLWCRMSGSREVERCHGLFAGSSFQSPVTPEHLGGAQSWCLHALWGPHPPTVLRREAPPACSGEAVVAQIKAPVTSPCKTLAVVQLPASPFDHE